MSVLANPKADPVLAGTGRLRLLTGRLAPCSVSTSGQGVAALNMTNPGGIGGAGVVGPEGSTNGGGTHPPRQDRRIG